MSSKRIAFITLNGFSFIPVFRYVVEFLSKHELCITEIAIKRAYSFEKYAQLNTIEKFENVKAFNNQSFKFKLKKYGKIIRYLIHLLKGNKDVIVYTIDFQVFVLSVFLNKFFKKKNVRYIYHQFELIDPSYLTRENRFLYRQFLKHSRLINFLIIPEENRLNHLLKISNINPKQTFLLPNTCRPNALINKKHDALKDIPLDAFVFGHIGNLGMEHYAKSFFNVAEKFVNQNVYFLIIGRQESQITTYIKQLGNPRIIVIDELPHEQLSNIYPFIDVGFVLYKGVNKNFEYCAPNKLYEYWSYGIPVLAHPLEGLIPVFVNELQGRLIDMEDEQVVYNTMKEFTEEGAINKKQLKEYFEESLAIEYFLPQLEKKMLAFTS